MSKTEEHIANYNGQLLSDLDGTPDTPKNSSTVPVPADTSLNITFSTSSTECENGFAWPITGPEDCWAFTYATGRATPFDSVQITANQGWSIEGYNASGCTGTPLWTYSSSDNQCVAFNNGSLAYFKMTPPVELGLGRGVIERYLVTTIEWTLENSMIHRFQDFSGN